MDSELTDWLTTQCVWAIQSEGDWYHKAQAACNEGNFGKFRRLCGTFINRIERMQGEKLQGIGWAYVVLELWTQMGGAPDKALTDPGTLGGEIQIEIATHFESATCHLDRVATNLETIMKEKPMSVTTNPNTAIETKTIIFGQDAASMSEGQLIDAIKKVEGQIAALKEVKTSSSKIAGNIKELEKQLDAIVAVLDAR